ncbi:serine/arginine repetitive matrix protein 1-like [Macrobrachium nipponense]|uniref:serine/arginine repetitive matrix protein 1-like n=1 Tax=Macrobrachium nipponense TaxID=159736 RepID=UPI0030C8451A
MSDVAPVFRVCAKEECKVRLPKAEVDPHTVCGKCRGNDCSATNTCVECESLTEVEWKSLAAYIRKLEKDRVRKASIRSSSRSCSIEHEVAPNSSVDSPAPSLVSAPSPRSEPVDSSTEMAAMRASILSLQSQLQAMKDKDSSSPRRAWSSSSKSRPLKRVWKPPAGNALDSSPEPFPEYSPARKKRVPRSPDSSPEGVSSMTKEGSSRKKDLSLLIKSSVMRASDSRRSGASKRPSPERYSSPVKPSSSFAYTHRRTSSPIKPSDDRKPPSAKRPSRSLSQGTSASPDGRQEPESLLLSDVSRISCERIHSSRRSGKDESPSLYRVPEESSRIRSTSRRASGEGRSPSYKRLESKRLPDSVGPSRRPIKDSSASPSRHQDLGRCYSPSRRPMKDASASPAWRQD